MVRQSGQSLIFAGHSVQSINLNNEVSCFISKPRAPNKRGHEDNSKIIFHISRQKHTL